jgi:Flp pilus assembly protein TadD
LTDAEREFRETVRLSPGFVEGHNNLGIVLGSLGRFDEAAEEFEAALRIDPGFSQSRANLAAAQGARRPRANGNRPSLR